MTAFCKLSSRSCSKFSDMMVRVEVREKAAAMLEVNFD